MYFWVLRLVYWDKTAPGRGGTFVSNFWHIVVLRSIHPQTRSQVQLICSPVSGPVGPLTWLWRLAKSQTILAPLTHTDYTVQHLLGSVLISTRISMHFMNVVIFILQHSPSNLITKLHNLIKELHLRNLWSIFVWIFKDMAVLILSTSWSSRVAQAFFLTFFPPFPLSTR